MAWLPQSVAVAAFFKSVGAGFVIGAVFALTSLLRGPRAGRAAAAAADILFFLSAAVLTFVFLLSVSFGTPRLFLFAGEGIGALLFYRVFSLMRRSASAGGTGKRRSGRFFEKK